MKLLLTLFALLALASATTAQEIIIARAGSQAPQQAPSENFTGNVRVERLFDAAAPARGTGGLVSFEAGARSAWHKHPLGQTLIVTAGTGRVQQWGSAVQEIRKGDTVRIPANVKHWHGASPASSMSHIAITEQLEGKAVEWMEKVSDADFYAPVSGQPSQAASSGPPERSNWSATLPQSSLNSPTMCSSATFGHGHNSRGAIAASSQSAHLSR